MSLDKKVLVAFNGMRGAYAEQVCTSISRNTVAVPCGSVEEVFGRVAGGNVKYGVIPIENCIGGCINDNYDLLLKYHEQYNASICQEVCFRIRHLLLAHPCATIESIRKVYAHPQALSQCRQFLQTRNYAPINVNDNGTAAALVSAHGRKDEAAIAGETAARIYRLNILARDIVAKNYNETRFLIIGINKKTSKPGKFSIAFRCMHNPGALYRCLGALKETNLTSIISRPIEQEFVTYRFFADFEARERNAFRAIEKLKKLASEVSVLGAYRTQAL